MPVQLNGRIKARIQIVPGLSREDMEKQVMEHPDVVKRLQDKEPKKVIVVPDKPVNIVC